MEFPPLLISSSDQSLWFLANKLSPLRRLLFLGAPLGVFAAWAIFPALSDNGRAKFGIPAHPPAIGSEAWLEQRK